MHCITFPEPRGLLFLTKLQPFTGGAQQLFLRRGGDVVNKFFDFKKQSFFHMLKLSSAAGSATDSAETETLNSAVGS